MEPNEDAIELEAGQGATETESDTSPGPGLYPGDTGLLPEAARRVLIQLLAGPSLERQRHPRLWPALLQHEDQVRSRLADLFLDLILDPERGVAFTRQADTGELEVPLLLRRSPLTFLDSVLLLYLRQVLVDAELHATPALVDREELAEQLRIYEPADNTDRAGFAKRIGNAIEKAKKNSLLAALRGNPDRFEVAASLKLIFDAEEVAQLTRLYAAMAQTGPGAGAVEPPEDDA